MPITETFVVAASPEAVFDYINPQNLAQWQTSKTSVSVVAEGELSGLMRLGEPLVKRAMARQFAGYHRNVQRNVGAG
ncbi:MAG TPA: hypothetical protein VHW96_10280 [Solirubrobacteraceae bacterium]|jgi:carbon monoxide dehydrogenase subunit G|nr:hypothetical protein [Solirubrobacteraceae bacterium]